MAQYIPKSAIVAEIERLRKKNNESKNVYDFGTEHALKSILSFLDIIEVKEVNIDKETERYCKSKEFTDALYTVRLTELIAKHFFELGVSTSNPLTWEDIKTIQNISGEVYAEVAKGKDDFYLIYPTEQSFLEEVLKRFKVQKGE